MQLMIALGSRNVMFTAGFGDIFFEKNDKLFK